MRETSSKQQFLHPPFLLAAPYLPSSPERTAKQAGQNKIQKDKAFLIKSIEKQINIRMTGSTDSVSPINFHNPPLITGNGVPCAPCNKGFLTVV